MFLYFSLDIKEKMSQLNDVLLYLKYLIIGRTSTREKQRDTKSLKITCSRYLIQTVSDLSMTHTFFFIRFRNNVA